MKNLIYALLGLIVGALAMYYFNQKGEGPIGSGEDPPVVEAPRDTISVAQAKILSNNWGTHNSLEIDSLISVKGPRKPMRSVWWSLEDITQYLAYAAEKSDTLGYTMTGVRVYLGNYGKEGGPIKKNRNTMFIVPTGPRNKSKSSVLNLTLQHTNPDIPAPPLNDGEGGGSGYDP